MPQKGWLCVFSDEEKTFKECIDCSKSPSHCEFTPEMLAIMSGGTRRKKDPMRLSVTGLLSTCLRKVVIQNRFDYSVSPRRAWFLFRGNMIHQILEDSMPTDGWKEVYHYRNLQLEDDRTVRVGGKVDKIVMDQLLIRDYKTTARLPTKTRDKYGSHELQLNIYRWIWWPIFHAEKLRLQYIDMRGTKQVKVELIDIEEIEKLILDKATAYVQALESPDIPTKIFDSVNNWFCRYCDVADLCKKLVKEEQE